MFECDCKQLYKHFVSRTISLTLLLSTMSPQMRLTAIDTTFTCLHMALPKGTDVKFINYGRRSGSRCVTFLSNGGMDSFARILIGCTLVKEEVGFVSWMTFTVSTSNYYYITSFWNAN